MTGGLLQIVNYGSQDMFLTSYPEITFFKIIFRRYTNFSIDSVFIPFQNSVGFGKISDCNIPRIGDLIHRIYIQITLPAIVLTRNLPSTNVLVQLNLLKQQYQYVTDFMKINMQAYRAGIEQIDTVNITPAMILLMIQNIFNTNQFVTTIKTNFESAISNTNFLYQEICIQDRINRFFDNDGNVISSVSISDIKLQLQNALYMSNLVVKYFYNKVFEYTTLYQEQTNTNAKIAWIKNIGHYIINYVEVSIGGDKIDHQTGEWLHIYHNLMNSIFLEDTYNKMIGNVDELTNIARNKQLYTLYIPLSFWFCNNIGNSIPLVAIEYHDIQITVKLRNFNECLYIAELSDEQLASNNRKTYIQELGIIDLQNYIDRTNNDVTMQLLVEYIYLDQYERKKFASGTHEYLIEQVQMNLFNDLSPIPTFLDLQFLHCCKYLIWVVQDQSIITYADGYNELKWNTYYTFFQNIATSIISKCSLLFNGVSRVHPLHHTYYNDVQAYETFKTSLPLGIYMYSFSLYPYEAQPSGHCNISNISKVTLNLNFDTRIIANTSYRLSVYAVCYNILRIRSGMVTTIFSIG
jgi:hypothetical protein